MSAERGELTGEHTLAGAPKARDAVRALRPSQIREVANAGFGVPDVLPFWFGESDRVTPLACIGERASRALADGARSTRTISALRRCATRSGAM